MCVCVCARACVCMHDFFLTTHIFSLETWNDYVETERQHHKCQYESCFQNIHSNGSFVRWVLCRKALFTGKIKKAIHDRGVECVVYLQKKATINTLINQLFLYINFHI